LFYDGTLEFMGPFTSVPLLTHSLLEEIANDGFWISSRIDFYGCNSFEKTSKQRAIVFSLFLHFPSFGFGCSQTLLSTLDSFHRILNPLNELLRDFSSVFLEGFCFGGILGFARIIKMLKKGKKKPK
jgi:hypothetical protein